MSDSGLDMSRENPERAGSIVGSGIGGIHTMETSIRDLNEKGPKTTGIFMIPRMIANIASGMIAAKYNLQGPNYSPVSACATGAHSIGDAMRFIKNGEADAFLAGGSESALTEIGLDGFGQMRALSKRNNSPEKASRPFDKDRDGFVIADGAAILLLEDLEHAVKRRAKIYCELSGHGFTCDAYHITNPNGRGAMQAMRKAIADSKINPIDISYIHAHGTSTQIGDRVETQAIKGVFGGLAKKLMVSATKSMTGHMIGASGGIGAAVCALTIQNEVIPPTTNYENPDSECNLDYVPNLAREKRVDFCLSNSFGFGGQNVSLAFERYE